MDLLQVELKGNPRKYFLSTGLNIVKRCELKICDSSLVLKWYLLDTRNRLQQVNF